MKKQKASHCVIRNQKLFCTHCGGSHAIIYPIGVLELGAKSEAFCKLHEDCKPVWKQQEADLTKTVKERAEWWLEHGERGTSSETIFSFFALKDDIGGCIPASRFHHPIDPDDFKRCSMVFKAFPEWKERINELKALSPVWRGLVDQWDKLEKLLAEQLETKEDNGMYDLMKSLGCD